MHARGVELFCAVFGGWSRCALYPVVWRLFKGYFEGLVVIKFSADARESIMVILRGGVTPIDSSEKSPHEFLRSSI